MSPDFWTTHHPSSLNQESSPILPTSINQASGDTQPDSTSTDHQVVDGSRWGFEWVPLT